VLHIALLMMLLARNFGGLATEVNGDIPVYNTSAPQTKIFDVGWTDNGDWAKYTRHYPAGVWNIYMRAANPNGPGTDSASISVGVWHRRVEL